MLFPHFPCFDIFYPMDKGERQRLQHLPDVQKMNPRGTNKLPHKAHLNRKSFQRRGRPIERNR